MKWKIVRRRSFRRGGHERFPAGDILITNLLDLSYPNDEPDEVIVRLVSELVGETLTLDQYRAVNEHLTGEDYTIWERFFPALGYLMQLVADQPDREIRTSMAVTLAVSMRYAVWGNFDRGNFDEETQKLIRDCNQLLLANLFETRDVEKQRYLLTGIAACTGDQSAITILHDLASGNTGEHSSIRIE